jgi:hypothetical protein
LDFINSVHALIVPSTGTELQNKPKALFAARRTRHLLQPCVIVRSSAKDLPPTQFPHKKAEKIQLAKIAALLPCNPPARLPGSEF